MTLNKIQMMAFKQIPPTGDFDLSDLKLYHALRLLYTEFGMLMVDQQTAMQEKQQLIDAWRKEKIDERNELR